MNTPEAKTPEKGDEEARLEAEPGADEGSVRHYGWAAGNRVNSVLHFIRNDSDKGMPITPKEKKVANLSSDATLSSGRDLGGVAGVGKGYAGGG